MKGLLFLKPSLTLYRCPLHRPRAPAARRAHLQLRAPASAAYTSRAPRCPHRPSSRRSSRTTHARTAASAPAARRAHLQLRAPASAAYTSPALRAVRSVPHVRTVPRACRSPAARLARIARVHILRARRYARARRTHPAVPARSPHAPCCLPSTLTPRPHRPYPHPAAPAPACTHRPLPRRTHIALAAHRTHASPLTPPCSLVHPSPPPKF